MPTVLGLLIGIALVVSVPRDYVATALVAASLPAEESDPAAGGSDAAVRAISDELLDDALLQKVATEEGLAKTAPLDDVVAGLRSRTSVSLIPPASTGGRNDAKTFRISYAAPTGELAERVANALARAFVEQRSLARDRPAERNSAQLGRDLELSRGKLSETEEALRQAKASSAGSASERGEPNQAVEELRRRLKSARDAAAQQHERLTALDQQIDAAKQQAAKAEATAEARSRERVNELERKLAEARKQYTSQHPDVQRLELDLAQARAEERATYSDAPLPDDPLRRMIADRDAAQLRSDELASEVKRVESELSRAQTRIDGSQVVERRVAQASREYDLAKQAEQRVDEQYQQALRAESLEAEQANKGDAALVAAATRPEAPSSLSPTLLLGGCLLGGLALGLAWAVGRHMLDRTFHDGRLLEEKYRTPVLSEIPHF